MPIAICTAACGRPELTQRTLASFMEHNPEARHMAKFMALDHFSADADAENAKTAAWYGWKVCAIAMPPRSGLMWAMRELVAAAVDAGCNQLLWLENDWECVQPLRTAPGISAEVDCVRLYGIEKQKDGKRPAGKLNMVTGMPIPWQTCERFKGKIWESARAHFGGAPCIVDLECLAPFVDRPSMKAMAAAMGELRTVRPTENYFWHSGIEGTDGFVH